MSTKVKIIIAVVIVLILVVFTAGLFIYINHLNNKITELETVTVEQSHTIETLQSNIDDLNSNLESYHATLVTISDYMSDVEKLKSNESAIKQAVYEEVISNPDSLEWFNERLPENIISIINDRAADGMCNN
jgi:uncharacterized coiled-coil protein SlyX